MVAKPSKSEQEYFIAQEVARLKKLREEHQGQIAAKARDEMKALHFMRCAKCGQKMETTKMAEIEVEVCPDCGGLYLDAGELARILDENVRGPFTSALVYARKLWNS